MNRTWVYSQMMGHAPLTALVGSRIHSSTSLTKAPDTKPFIMYRSSSHLSDFRGDDSDLVRNENFQIFVHDLPGDYLQIEVILGILKDLFADTADPADNIIRCMWLEDSEDFRDEDMGTILRYARISVKYRT